jgi:hypothetical protein
MAEGAASPVRPSLMTTLGTSSMRWRARDMLSMLGVTTTLDGELGAICSLAGKNTGQTHYFPSVYSALYFGTD